MARFLTMASTIRNRATKAAAIAFWLIVWEVSSLLIGEEIFLPSPLSVIRALSVSMAEVSFWEAILFTLSRIILGFVSALVSALLLSAMSFRWKWLGILLDPALKIVRATPVASIVILILVWVRSRNLSVIISFMMVFPVVYQNILSGLRDTDRGILEMAEVYKIKLPKRIRYIYLPHLVPYIESAISTSLGLAWKSGIAAEVIGLPDGSIGERVYEAKIYLSMPDLFAMTLTVIILAFLFERVFLALSHSLLRRAFR